VYIYGSYRKIKTGLSLFLDHSVVQPTRCLIADFSVPHLVVAWTVWLLCRRCRRTNCDCYSFKRV